MIITIDGKQLKLAPGQREGCIMEMTAFAAARPAARSLPLTDSIVWKRATAASGSTPGQALSPSIVHVLPLPVWPYAKSEAL